MSIVAAWENVSPQRFSEEILPRNEPAVLRGLVCDWPAVWHGQRGGGAIAAYLAGLATQAPIGYVRAGSEIAGRLHYTADMRGLNFDRAMAPLPAFLEALLDVADVASPPALAAQGLSVPHCLPGFVAENTCPLLPVTVSPRAWIGNRIEVATHNDPAENIACVVAGRRRFTLFAPDQISNLYIGPLHFTPAGTPISMVHVNAPDFQRYPRFATAMANSMTADLVPGDALYIPYHWYHHVESLDAVNVLINYWWNPASGAGGSPWDALLHAIMSVRSLPAGQRRAWRAAFDHYAFLARGPAGAHLPAEVRGILGADTPADLEQMRLALVQNLSGQPPR